MHAGTLACRAPHQLAVCVLMPLMTVVMMLTAIADRGALPWAERVSYLQFCQSWYPVLDGAKMCFDHLLS